MSMLPDTDRLCAVCGGTGYTREAEQRGYGTGDTVTLCSTCAACEGTGRHGVRITPRIEPVLPQRAVKSVMVLVIVGVLLMKPNPLSAALGGTSGTSLTRLPVCLRPSGRHTSLTAWRLTHVLRAHVYSRHMSHKQIGLKAAP